MREYRLPREAVAAGAPRLARGVGGAARGHADDGADPQPGDDDPCRRPRAGLGGDRARAGAARRCRADPQGARAPDRRAGRRSAPTRRAAACAVAARGRRSAQVVDALDAAFYAAFENVEPAGKRSLLALDVSGSMSCGQVAGAAGAHPPRRLGGDGARHRGDRAQYEVVGFFAGESGADFGQGRRFAGRRTA